MSNAKIKRSNQITFLHNFIELWEKINSFDDDNALFNNVQNHLTEMLNAFCLSNGLTETSADELLAELEAMPTLYNWEQMQASKEMIDRSGIDYPELWLWDKGQNIDVWYPVINIENSTKRFFIKDLSGHGATNNYADLLTLSKIEEKNYDGESLMTWGNDAEEGDEFINATTKVICIEG